MTRVKRTIGGLMLAALLAPAAGADWLVTRDGARIETRGAWTVKGAAVVFTTAAGTLSSLRLAEVDLDASAEATRRAALPPPPPPAPPPPPPKRPPVLTLTNADVGTGAAAAAGTQALVDRFRTAHRQGDITGAMSLVLWEGVPAHLRQAMRATFDWVMSHDLRSVTVVAATADDTAPQEHEGVTYRPNLEVVGKLEIELELTAEERADADRASASFLIGDRLGTPVIVAPVPGGGIPGGGIPGGGIPGGGIPGGGTPGGGTPGGGIPGGGIPGGGIPDDGSSDDGTPGGG